MSDSSAHWNDLCTLLGGRAGTGKVGVMELMQPYEWGGDIDLRQGLISAGEARRALLEAIRHRADLATGRQQWGAPEGPSIWRITPLGSPTGDPFRREDIWDTELTELIRRAITPDRSLNHRGLSYTTVAKASRLTTTEIASRFYSSITWKELAADCLMDAYIRPGRGYDHYHHKRLEWVARCFAGGCHNLSSHLNRIVDARGGAAAQ